MAFGAHVSLRGALDVVYPDICLPVYFFGGNRGSGNQRNGKTKCRVKLKEKLKLFLTICYFMYDETFNVIREDSFLG